MQQMNKKPQLKIDTVFYNEEQPFEPHSSQINALIETPQNLDQKSAAAAMFQRLFSANLAGKFISCWHALKDHGREESGINSRNYLNLNNYNNHNIQHRQVNSQYYAFQKAEYPRDYESNYLYSQNFHKVNISRSSPKDILNIQSLKQSQHKSDRESETRSRRNRQTHQRQDNYFEGNQIDRDQHILKHQTHQKFERNHSRSRMNRSQDRNNSRSRRRLRQTDYYQQKRLKRCSSADLRVQVSRAHILNKIAQKLRQNQKFVIHEETDTEVISRLSKLERLMKDIRTTNQKANQKNIVSSSRVSVVQNQRQKGQIGKMLQQIYGLKRQINTIKHYNQQILKNDVNKSAIRQSNMSYQINGGYSALKNSNPIGRNVFSNFDNHNFNSQLSSQPQFSNSIQRIQRRQFNFLPAPSLTSNVNTSWKPFQQLNKSSKVQFSKTNESSTSHVLPILNANGPQNNHQAIFSFPQQNKTSTNQGSIVWNNRHNVLQNNSIRGTVHNQSHGTFGNRVIRNVSLSGNLCSACGRSCNCLREFNRL